MTQTAKAARMPPRWFVRTFWVIHRAVHRLTGGRLGLWKPSATKWGTIRLHTVGRRTGQLRSAILGYFEDGPNLVTLAMNGWAAPEPAWWLNLQAMPDAVIELQGERRNVHGRVAEGDERERLWQRWHDYGDDLSTYSRLRPRETAIVVLEPRPIDANA